MELNIANIRGVSQVALLGAITPNLRVVEIQLKEKKIEIKFYYHQNFSELEDDQAEIVSSELISSFTDCNLEVIKQVYSYPQKISPQGIVVYHRYEPLLSEDNL